ncbi:DUF3565 domain-containing protein [Crateriforma conspicua]|uniref:Pressure-regulated protein n=1 Tax=Crateriforma conspicua TaxID=2527996 RepID=A0A5C5Y058_9PLAN|nr:DUF3565 domain-containing protein [Crateriforma conspicua]QDV62551.1 hypothetical protein Mal65_16850 [Crateriforma conspicua]TWT68640.1 hypothetical protein Pan14r_08870 [Crateriforma conspicua]
MTEFDESTEQDATKPQPILGFHTDDEGHWVSQLACGHNQHVRHDPPLVTRNWVLTQQGRDTMIGYHLGCKKCIDGAPADDRPETNA